MRRILKTIGVLSAVLVALAIAWVFGGRSLSLVLDRLGTVEVESKPIQSISYEGTGAGGALLINGSRLSLTPAGPAIAEPHVGTTKDEQLALSYADKVFPFGPVSSGEKEMLTAKVGSADRASMAKRRSYLSWPNLFQSNFMTGWSPLWLRHQYYQLIWTKQDGVKLEVMWRFEQYCYRGAGWTDALMTREGATGLIRIDISQAAR
jgi:hypothetical protein